MEIRIDFKTALILILTVIILVLGAYFYRGYDNLAMRQIIVQGETILNQLQMTPQIIDAFRQAGYNIKPQLQPTVDKKEEE